MSTIPSLLTTGGHYSRYGTWPLPATDIWLTNWINKFFLLWIYIAKLWKCPRPKFLHFHDVFRKFWLSNRLAPLLGNARSATYLKDLKEGRKNQLGCLINWGMSCLFRTRNVQYLFNKISLRRIFFHSPTKDLITYFQSILIFVPYK